MNIISASDAGGFEVRTVNAACFTPRLVSAKADIIRLCTFVASD